MKDQQKMYQAKKLPSWYKKSRVDDFWSRVPATTSGTTGLLKYGLLRKVVCSFSCRMGMLTAKEAY